MANRLSGPLALLAKVWPPMLATLASVEELGPGYDVLEAKYDGFRALAAVADGKVALQSRNALDLAARFPQAVSALRDLAAGEAVLDGELIAQRGRDFHSLQMGSPDIGYVVFDLLWLDGLDLRPLPFRERRAALEKLFGGEKRAARGKLRLGERLRGPAAQALARAKATGMEGIVCKRGDSPYRGGRQRDWLKLKVITADEFLIAGYVPHSKLKGQVGALALATTGKLPRYAGKVGTGFPPLRAKIYLSSWRSCASSCPPSRTRRASATSSGASPSKSPKWPIAK